MRPDRARAFTDRLGVPVLAVPGNHDIPLLALWARLRCPYARYAAALGDDLEPVHRGPALMVVGVNTTRASRHQNGEVGAQQVERVARLLQAGTAVSSRVRAGAPNSVNLVRWGEGGAPGVCQIEQWDFSASAGAFERAKVTQVRPGRA